MLKESCAQISEGTLFICQLWNQVVAETHTDQCMLLHLRRHDDELCPTVHRLIICFRTF